MLLNEQEQGLSIIVNIATHFARDVFWDFKHDKWYWTCIDPKYSYNIIAYHWNI